MSEGIWKLFVALGVPGLSLGVFYALMQAFSLDLSELDPLAQVGVFALLLVISAIITLMALRMWRPRSTTRSRSSVKIGAKTSIGGSVAGRDNIQGSGRSRSADANDLSSQSTVQIGNLATVTGPVAGRDNVLINHDRLPDKTEELSSLLETRANKIKSELGRHFQYASVEKFLSRFEELHTNHIEALRKGHIIHAHEILNEIHELSFQLQKDEFWSRVEHTPPNINYRDPSQKQLENGFLILSYIGSAAIEKLIEERSKRGLKYNNPAQDTRKPQESVSETYSLILSSDT